MIAGFALGFAEGLSIEETLRKAVADLVQDLGFGGFAFLGLRGNLCNITR